MQQDTYPKETILIYWANRTMIFRNENGAIVKVKFLKSKKGGSDIFEVCCFIALAQQFFYEEDTNFWTGINASLYDAAQNEFSWDIGYSSLNTYKNRLKSGKDSDVHLTNISIANKDKEEFKAPNIQSNIAKDLVWISKGNVVLGKPQKQKNDCVKLWSVEFRDENNKDENNKFRQFEKRAITLLHQAIIPIPINKKLQLVKAVTRMGNSPFQLSNMLRSAEKSIFIIGQNLYTLVEHEVIRGVHKRDNRSHYRILIEDWLLEKEKKRNVYLLICDPRSSHAVVHYSMVFGENFIPHLCNSIKRYKLWQEEMESIGFHAKVTRTIPLSIVAIDGDVDDKNIGEMTITPLAFEPTSSLRPSFKITKKYHHEIFETYYNKFFDLLSSRHTRSVCKVENDELEKCNLLTLLSSVLHRSINKKHCGLWQVF